ncbi:hypothetical protein [Brevibacillus laterosporus]|uniref:DUF1433 domain-containing protein n=1 Tax=Brevibacillus laterosporus TaxID=1465 RepID=A0AAP8QAZ9_BRELA|nr:hypothetical protein [Brevibacillus laterosporus]MED1663245.1 hypothetical protein [Brevibacillus laterosporus]MED1669444.1 hypothetical protein [Brevibacillus laterosporus]MED1717724.1 hypothetical protein [Brevibacillus laterosporus]PPA84471.1 hypothetical protein C4A76_17655 [Brevibacillus laterosporus]PPA91518.1 hypothetical protein C4A77_22475 [Brevibacillus laterosporus]
MLELNKFWKTIILIAGIAVGYCAWVIFVAESLPSPTDKQLSQAEKVAERYLKETEKVDVKITSTGFIAEMYDHTINIEGYSKDNPQQVFRVSFEQVKNTEEIVTDKSIIKICTSNDKGLNFECKDVKKLK